MSSNALCLDASNNAKIPEFKRIIMFNVFAKMIPLRLICAAIKSLQVYICSQMQVMISCGVCGNALIEEIYEILLKLDFRLLN